MKRLCLTLALAFAACAVRAEAYSWDFSSAAAEAAEAPVVRRASSNPAAPAFPVCGILTTPYPCLIARDGKRYLEGAVLDSGVIVKIEADSVTLTNSTGRFTWKP